MNVGYRTGPSRKAESPGDLDPIARTVMEWAFPTQVNSHLFDEPIQYIEVDNDPNANFDFYQFDDPNTSQEFLVENRQYSGFNSYLPEWWKSGDKGGLLIWWRNGQSRQLRPGDNDTDVVLEGLPYVSDGDLGDPFPGSTNNTSITMATTPDTRNSLGNPTGFAVTDISSSATTMTANFYHNYWSGSITSNTTWSGEIYVGGDITVNSGVTLTISPGTTVNFATTDDQGG
ncbi:MAG TPA: hypothetical protein EYP19_02760, partial [Desulfobacterales bacterium]|nr:hypothetical protein [Desulfobacterales bacterium]